MKKRNNTLKQTLDDSQNQKNSSHSDLRPKYSPPTSPQGELSNGGLEPVFSPSGSQIYPQNERSISSKSMGPRRNDAVPRSTGQASLFSNDIPDSPICTPRKARTMPTKDSPIKSALGSNSTLRKKYVNGQRDAIIKDLGGSVPRGSLDYFKEILPPIRPEFDINKISSHLIRNGDLVQEGGINVWKEFRMATAATMTEEKFFNKPLVNVFNAIRDAALKTSNIDMASTVDMVTDGNNAPWSVKRNSSRPDGYLVLKETEEGVKRRGKEKEKREDKDLWYNIAVSLSLKTVDNSENIRNAVRNMRRVLAVDPTRRFTYGIDIEGTELGLWIATRAMVIACDTFDFRTRYNDLIWIFLSLSFASKEDLGWDMSIKPTLNATNDERLYSIEVGGEYYHTSESDMISGEKADGLVTSATRIWKAKRDRDGTDVIIKDFWPSDERETEDVIRKKILDDIKGSKKRKFFRRHTLKPISAGRVKCNGKDDHTKDTILRGHSPYTDKLYKTSIDSGQSSRKNKGSKSAAPGVATEMKDDTQPLSRELEQNQRKEYYHRYHYRIVYKEVAVPYCKLRKTGAMIKVIIDTVETLLYLHEAGWVHRDISAGNLYLYTDPVSRKKRGLVGDLEYAKKVGEGGKLDACTGTLDFMAIEVACRAYQFLSYCLPKREKEEEGPYSSGDEDDKDDDSEDDDSEDDDSEVDDSKINDSDDDDGGDDDRGDDNSEDRDTEYYGPESSGERGINHNYIHDLESLWWILVWTVFVYEKMPALADETSANWVKGQRISYFDLFPGNTVINNRLSFLRDASAFKSYMVKVPPFFKGYARIIARFRILLFYEYNAVEKNGPAPFCYSSPNTIHRNFLKELLKEKIEKGRVVSVWDRDLRKRSPEARNAEARDDLQQSNSKKAKTKPKDTRSTKLTDSPLL